MLGEESLKMSDLEQTARRPMAKRFNDSPAAMRWSMLLLLLATIWSVALLHSDISYPYTTANDMTPDYISARAWLHGVEPYAPIPELKNRYLGRSTPYFLDSPPDQSTAPPPIGIFFFTPFALLPIKATRILWLVLMAGMIAYSLVVFTRELGWSKRGQFVVATLSLSVPAVRSDFFFAQTNGLVLRLLVASWVALRRNRDARAGALLGILAAIRLFPILLVVPLVRMRRFRSVAWMVGTAAGLSLIGLLALGLHSTRVFVDAASPANTKYWVSQPGNLSLVGLPFRWLTKNRWMAAGVNAPAIALALAGIAFIFCVVAMYRSPVRVSGDAFWASIPWMLLAAPLSWFHYAVMLLPLVILLERGTRRSGVRRFLVLLACGCALVARLVADRFIAHGLDAYSAFVQAAGYSIAMYGMIGLGAAEWLKPSARRQVVAPVAQALRA